MRRNTNAEEYGTHGNFENVLSSAADVFKLYIKSTYNIGKLIVLQGTWFTTICIIERGIERSWGDATNGAENLDRLP